MFALVGLIVGTLPRPLLRLVRILSKILSLPAFFFIPIWIGSNHVSFLLYVIGYMPFYGVAAFSVLLFRRFILLWEI